MIEPGMDSRKAAYLIVLSGSIAWCLILFLPAMESFFGRPGGYLTSFADRLLSRICHQLDDRSFVVEGAKLAACVRCTSIYVGFLAGVATIGFARKAADAFRLNHRRWWGVALLPMLVDVALDVTGIHHSTLLTRMITGSLFGVTAAFLLTPLFVEGWTSLIAPLSISFRRHDEPETR